MKRWKTSEGLHFLLRWDTPRRCEFGWRHLGALSACFFNVRLRAYGVGKGWKLWG